jgi:tRNA(Ile)-lysidine synthase TilS/MesJ
MRQWLGIALLVVIFLTIINVTSFVRRKQDEDQYRARLSALRSAVKPGASRADVENYLRRQGMPYVRSCCNAGVFSDRSKIGQLPPKWTCRNWNVYLDFRFQNTEGNVASGDDRLTKIDLYEDGECL